MKKLTDGVPPTDVILPNIKIHEWVHEYRLPIELTTNEKKLEAKQNLMKALETDEMLPFYKYLCAEFGWQEDTEFVQKLSAANIKEFEELDAAVMDAQENFGDVEVKDCLLSKAHFYCRIGDIDKAVEAYEIAQKKTVGSGGRLDIILTLVRIGLLYNQPQITKKYLSCAKRDCEKGGDWERRNKLKIYEAIYLAQYRRFFEAAELLYSCVAIFTASELISFQSFIFVTVILATAAFDRPLFKSKIMASPEIAQVLEENEVLKEFVHSFFYCKYKHFMYSLVKISCQIRRDPHLLNHLSYLTRAIRLKAYHQFLEPFSSVKVSSMAEAFGVSERFVEDDVADYISNGKLNCKIDRVNGVILCIRHVPTDTLYLKAMKEGDLLLNKIQKLSKIIDM